MWVTFIAGEPTFNLGSDASLSAFDCLRSAIRTSSQLEDEGQKHYSAGSKKKT
jgi:hypothetical protein